MTSNIRTTSRVYCDVKREHYLVLKVKEKNSNTVNGGNYTKYLLGGLLDNRLFFSHIHSVDCEQAS